MVSFGTVILLNYIIFMLTSASVILVRNECLLIDLTTYHSSEGNLHLCTEVSSDRRFTLFGVLAVMCN